MCGVTRTALALVVRTVATMAATDTSSIGGSGSVSAGLARGRSGSDGGVELLPTIHLDGDGSESVEQTPAPGPPRKHSGAQRGRTGSSSGDINGSRRTASDASARRGDLVRACASAVTARTLSALTAAVSTSHPSLVPPACSDHRLGSMVKVTRARTPVLVPGLVLTMAPVTRHRPCARAWGTRLTTWPLL